MRLVKITTGKDIDGDLMCSGRCSAASEWDENSLLIHCDVDKNLKQPGTVMCVAVLKVMEGESFFVEVDK